MILPTIVTISDLKKMLLGEVKSISAELIATSGMHESPHTCMCNFNTNEYDCVLVGDSSQIKITKKDSTFYDDCIKIFNQIQKERINGTVAEHTSAKSH